MNGITLSPQEASLQHPSHPTAAGTAKLGHSGGRTASHPTAANAAKLGHSGGRTESEVLRLLEATGCQVWLTPC